MEVLRTVMSVSRVSRGMYSYPTKFSQPLAGWLLDTNPSVSFNPFTFSARLH